MSLSRPFLLGLGGLIAAAALVAPAGAHAAPQAQASVCDGVNLLTAPQVAVGIGSIVTSLIGPLDDTVICQLVTKRGSAAQRRTAGGGGGTETGPGGLAQGSGHCKNGQQAGFQLRAGEAAKAVRCLINNERGSRGLGGLSPRDSLRAAAQQHTSKMLSTGCFSHQCSGEPDLVGRVTATGYLPCNCAWSVGEDLAWGRGGKGTPKSVVRAWMGSPPHRANILNPAFKELDVGVGGGRPGASKAKATTYTANFGYRR